MIDILHHDSHSVNLDNDTERKCEYENKQNRDHKVHDDMNIHSSRHDDGNDDDKNDSIFCVKHDHYIPTVGCRIVEVGLRLYRPTNEPNKIELWEVGHELGHNIDEDHGAGAGVGQKNQDKNKQYQNWSAIWEDMDGVILIYDPSNIQHHEEVQRWYESVSQQHVDDAKAKLSNERQCLVVHNPRMMNSATKNSTDENDEDLPSCLHGCTVIRGDNLKSVTTFKTMVMQFLQQL